jgi:translation initiation factor IF-3
LQRLYDDIEDLATIEQEPEQEGRNMSMLLAPVRAKGGDAERSAAA